MPLFSPRGLLLDGTLALIKILPMYLRYFSMADYSRQAERIRNLIYLMLTWAISIKVQTYETERSQWFYFCQCF